MTDLPAPLTPEDCDLRDFQFMPMDIVRLFGSRFHAISNDAEWRAGITLWLKSFHQVPAASIPDDEVELARLAEFGRDLKSFRKIRIKALHGWVKCSDGRLYHPVVAEKANEAYKKKEFYRERSKKASAKRWGRLDNDGEPQGNGDEREDSGRNPNGNDQGSHEGNQQASHKDASSNASASQGRVKGQGDIEEDSVPDGTAHLTKKPDGELPLPIDPTKAFFDEAVGYLGGKHRALIARWSRDFGIPHCATALKLARAEQGGQGAENPVAFMTRVLANGAEREAARIEEERRSRAAFDRRHPPRFISPEEAAKLYEPDKLKAWLAETPEGRMV